MKADDAPDQDGTEREQDNTDVVSEEVAKVSWLSHAVS